MKIASEMQMSSIMVIFDRRLTELKPDECQWNSICDLPVTDTVCSPQMSVVFNLKSSPRLSRRISWRDNGTASFHRCRSSCCRQHLHQSRKPWSRWRRWAGLAGGKCKEIDYWYLSDSYRDNNKLITEDKIAYKVCYARNAVSARAAIKRLSYCELITRLLCYVVLNIIYCEIVLTES